MLQAAVLKKDEDFNKIFKVFNKKTIKGLQDYVSTIQLKNFKKDIDISKIKNARNSIVDYSRSKVLNNNSTINTKNLLDNRIIYCMNLTLSVANVVIIVWENIDFAEEVGLCFNTTMEDVKVCLNEPGLEMFGCLFNAYIYVLDCLSPYTSTLSSLITELENILVIIMTDFHECFAENSEP